MFIDKNEKFSKSIYFIKIKKIEFIRNCIMQKVIKERESIYR